MKKIDLDKAPNPAKDYPAFPSLGQKEPESKEELISNLNRVFSGIMTLAWLRGVFGRGRARAAYLDNWWLWAALLFLLLAAIWFPRFFAKLLRRLPGGNELFRDEDKIQWWIRASAWALLIIALWIVTVMVHDNWVQSLGPPKTTP